MDNFIYNLAAISVLLTIPGIYLSSDYSLEQSSNKGGIND